MKENIALAIDEIRENRSLLTMDEASIKNGVILRLLSLLGWNTYNVDEVKPEYTVGTKRVDFALRIEGKSKLFIEAKRSNENLEQHQDQLLDYSYREGIRLAILTNGLTWWFYLPLLDVSWEQRRFFSADILEQDSTGISDKFIQLLSKSNVSSGKAVENANNIYEGHQKIKIIRETLPKAWAKLIGDPDEQLIELLNDTTEKLSGFRPEISDIEKFLRELNTIKPDVTLRVQRSTIASKLHEQNDFINTSIKSIILFGKTYNPRSWKELLIIVAEEMYSLHRDEFNKSLSLRGSKMAYFSQNRNELSMPTQIAGSDYYVETKLNANSIVRRCRELMSLFGYKEDDLKVVAE